MHGAVGLGGTAQIPLNEPFSPNTLYMVSGCSSSLRSVRCYGRFTLGIRLGLFPLGLRTPCSLVPPYPRTPSLRVGSSGRLLFGERKESSPQLGLLLVPSESALRTTPLLVFIRVFILSLPLFDSLPSTGEEFVQAHGRS
jgi:hypothetical protein